MGVSISSLYFACYYRMLLLQIIIIQIKDRLRYRIMERCYSCERIASFFLISVIIENSFFILLAKRLFICYNNI